MNEWVSRTLAPPALHKSLRHSRQASTGPTQGSADPNLRETFVVLEIRAFAATDTENALTLTVSLYPPRIPHVHTKAVPDIYIGIPHLGLSDSYECAAFHKRLQRFVFIPK